MANPGGRSPWWRWVLVPVAVVLSGSLVVALGTVAYSLFFDLLCPTQARFDSRCYSQGVLLAEKWLILCTAGLCGISVIWSGYLAAPQAPFLTVQWLALAGSVTATLALLALDWSMWPLYGAFLAGLALALLSVRVRIRGT